MGFRDGAALVGLLEQMRGVCFIAESESDSVFVFLCVCLCWEEVGTQVFCDISKLRFCVLSWPCHTVCVLSLHLSVCACILVVHFCITV